MILYFSGTGNSQHLAQLIAQHLGDSVHNAADFIKQEKHPDFSSEKPYVFVAPTYAWRIPRVFENWIAACKFQGSKKAYFILTCGGEIGAAGSHLAKFAEQAGFIHMGTARVVMPENYLIMFEPTAKEEDRAIISAAEMQAAALCKQISQHIPFEKDKIPLLGHLKSGIINNCFYTYYVGAKKFFTTDACISCGKCVEYCMMNNIALKDGKPIWGDHCTHCLACICKCPTEAIEYGKNTAGKRRYVFRRDLP